MSSVPPNTNDAGEPNVPSASSQPSTEDPDIGSTSSEGGEMVKTVSLAYADAIVQYTVPRDNSFHTTVTSSGNDVLGVSGSVGGVNYGELYKVAGLLDGSNKQVMKCSLNDIMFLVMLLLIQASADQRSSRLEDMSAKKKVSDKAADAVFRLGLDSAKAAYEAEKKAATIKIVTGYIGIGISVASMGLAAISCGRGIGGAMVRAAQKVGKAVSDTLKMVMKVLLMMEIIVKFASLAMKTASAVTTFVLKLDVAKERKRASYLNAEEKRIRAFFEFNMQQIKNMQEAYSTSQKNIHSALKEVREIIQQKQETTITIARNI